MDIRVWYQYISGRKKERKVLYARFPTVTNLEYNIVSELEGKRDGEKRENEHKLVS